jgi:hypothetical protein
MTVTRWVGAFVGSLSPVFIAGTLGFHHATPFVSFVSASLISFDFVSIVSSRMGGSEPYLSAFISVSIFLLAVWDRNGNRWFGIAGIVAIAFALVIDSVSFIFVVFECIFLIQSRRAARKKMLAGLVSLFVFVNIADFVYRYFAGIGSFPEFGFWGKIAGKRSSWYVFPLWQFRPKVLLAAGRAKVVLLYHPVSVGVCLLFCGLGILKLESMFYYLSIFWISVLSPKGIAPGYQFALIFGALSVGKGLMQLPVRSFFSVPIAAALLLVFCFWSAWVYAIDLSPELDNTINLWREVRG